MRLLAAIFWVAVLVSACSRDYPGSALEPPKCLSRGSKPGSDLLALINEFQDGVKVVAVTPRIALAGQIPMLQSVMRRTTALEVPECAKPARDKVVAAMSGEIDVFLKFLAVDPSLLNGATPAEQDAITGASAARKAWDDAGAEVSRALGGVGIGTLPGQ